MSRSKLRAAIALSAAFAFSAGIAAAQSPAVNTKEAAQATAEQRQQLNQPLNNEPVWKEVRSGAPQTTTVRGRETDVLIQPEGQTWRALRVPIMFWGGLLLAFAVGVLAVFYLWRGAIGVGKKPGDRIIERFSPMDRYAHWLVAIVWVTLAITGLILSLGKAVLLPLIGYTLFSWLATLAKYLHNFIGPILIIGVPWLFIRFVRDNGVGADDVRWMANVAGYIKGHETPSGRFNAGEKVQFWFVLVIASVTLIVTGLIMLFPNFDQLRSTMMVANVLHMVAAYLSIALACVHVYLGTIGVAGAYRAMRDGYVDASWAEHYHLLWYKDVAAGKASQKFVVPGEAQAQGERAVPRTKPA